MVEAEIWDKLAFIAKEHAALKFPKFRKTEISRETSLAEGLGLQGELAMAFLEDIERTFVGFAFSERGGDFCFDDYFRSEISETFLGSWLYLFYPKVQKLDANKKLPLTLGMLEDAISRGHWETARYR